MKLPTRHEALKKMREAGCSQSVLDHCISVTRLALRLADEFKRRGFTINRKLIEAGALMHDLGRSKTHSVEHGAIGGQLSRKMGLPEPLTRVIERHVGAGITPEEASEIGLSEGKYIPETLEEKIVVYADKLIEGNQQVDMEITIEKFAKELGRDHPSLNRLRDLHNEMVRLIGPEI